MGRSLEYFVIITGSGNPVEISGQFNQLAHSIPHLTTDHIALLLPPVPQFHVVDPNSHNSPPVLDNTSFFHDETAENHLPTVPDGSVHEKEFLYTSPQTYGIEVQSGSVVADNDHQPHHNTQQHHHV
jgi:hypothetical protein